MKVKKAEMNTKNLDKVQIFKMDATGLYQNSESTLKKPLCRNYIRDLAFGKNIFLSDLTGRYFK